MDSNAEAKSGFLPNALVVFVSPYKKKVEKAGDEMEGFANVDEIWRLNPLQIRRVYRVARRRRSMGAQCVCSAEHHVLATTGA